MPRGTLRRIVALFAIVSLGTAGQAQDRSFVRGDVNQDDAVNVADATALLSYLFSQTGGLACEKAADLNDSGDVNITDAIYTLEFLFGGGAPPPPPTGMCGPDPTPDALTCGESLCGEATPSVIINEFMASNLESLADEDGDREDWIELRISDASSGASVDLSGWHLTDDAEMPARWRFPDGVRLEQGQHLVVFASGKDRAVAGSELHTSFRLERDGEYLGLVAADGTTVVDEIAPAYPEQLPDISYGAYKTTATLVRAGDEARYHVPTASDAGLGDSWSSPGFDVTGWAMGRTGIGFKGTGTTKFEVTTIKATVEVDHLDVADAVLSDPGMQSSAVTDSTTLIDFLNTGDGGNYPGDAPFPGLEAEDEDDFVVYVTGTVVIPEAGLWTFGISSDDGFRLELTGDASTFKIEHPTPRAARNTVRVFNAPAAGPYALTLLSYERTGGAELELFAARGSHLAFNPSAFRLVGDQSAGGLGLLGFEEEIETDVAPAMRGVNSSLWTRIDFEVDDPNRFGSLSLRVKYADGFAAYLNGHEVARRNAPEALGWDAAAVSSRFVNDVLVAERIDLTAHLDRVTAGTNILALHVLNDSVADDAFLIQPELSAGGRFAELVYMPQPSPGEPNLPGAVDFAREVEFGVERGFFDSPFLLELETVTPDAEIRYTLDGATPTATTGSVYDGPITIDSTSVVRAAAFKPDYLDSGVTTRSYIFVSDVVRQSSNGQRPGPDWPAGRLNGQTIDYGMDPAIVNSGTWGGRVEEALLAVSSISLVTDLPNLFSPSTGIYVNAQNDGRAWERRTSVELLHPDGTDGFGLDAGLRIRGAFSRNGGNPKHSFRLIFRSEYGAGKLQYALFGGEGADEFDRIDLRTSQNYSWAQGSEQNTFLRDVFSRDVQRDMGQPYTRSRYYHLYINGQYWGLYQTQERADADFAASYLGGNDDDYDVIKNDSSGSRALEATDGTMDAYRRLYDAATRGFSSDADYLAILGRLPDGTPDPEGERLLDAENLMDYMICTYYTGDPDAPVSAWAHFSNNVFAIFNREKPRGFTWYRHDAEHSLGANGGLFENRLLTDPVDRSIGREWRHFNPAWLHLQLTEHPEYLLQFADRVNRYFSAGGLLTSDENLKRWTERARQIETAVIAASARWGDARSNSPLTKDDWLAELDWVETVFFPRRTQIVLDDMRSVGMFPDLAVVSFSRHGGEVEPGFQLALTQENGDPGTIYYTLDGSDPREWGGGTASTAEVYPGEPGDSIVLSRTTTVRARVRGAGSWGALTGARFTVGLEGLVINEFMASNSVTLEDPDEPGEFPDWIELYNGAAGTIDLEGMYITDDLTDLTKWQIAPGVTMSPEAHLVFLADDDGTQGPLHTNFKLSQSGEVIALVDADGTTILDSITFDAQTTDVSFGRSVDGGADWGFREQASPGSSN